MKAHGVEQALPSHIFFIHGFQIGQWNGKSKPARPCSIEMCSGRSAQPGRVTPAARRAVVEVYTEGLTP